jgi:hypothetical protein
MVQPLRILSYAVANHFLVSGIFSEIGDIIACPPNLDSYLLSLDVINCTGMWITRGTTFSSFSNLTPSSTARSCMVKIEFRTSNGFPFSRREFDPVRRNLFPDFCRTTLKG